MVLFVLMRDEFEKKIYTDENCHRCGGSGIDPDPPPPTYFELLYGDAPMCYRCSGMGKEYEYG
jgi:hypothetical protein